VSLLWKAVESLLPGSGSHSIEHTRRVHQICLFLGEKLGADLAILLPAAVLHDIGRRRDVANHAEESARLAEKLLGELGFEEPRIKPITEVIRTHSFSGDQRPGSLEAEILSDADKLDALGAVGVYRAAAYTSEEGRSLGDFINHFHEKLLKLPEFLYTGPAREMALQRKEFLVRYLEEIGRELKLEA
jgi:uncharacterized protein